MTDVNMAEEGFTDSFNVGRNWLEAIQDSRSPTEDFTSLLLTHFGEHVLECFELHVDKTIKSFVNVKKCQSLIFSPMEYFLCGEDSNTGFEKLEKLNKPPLLCGKVFRAGEPTYSCRDCGYDNTCVLCINCFQKGIHKNHHYKLNTSGGGGTCDCGDPEAWIDGYACENHRPTEGGQEDAVAELPASVARQALCIYTAAIQYIALLCLENESQAFPDEIQLSQQKLDTESRFITMLFNDEVHTYEEVIRTLQKAIPDCSQADALAYANTVDREGRAPVLVGPFAECEQARKVIKSGTSGPGRNPLKCQVMHRCLVAHQAFAVYLLEWINTTAKRSDGLRRLLCEIVSQPLERYRGECLLDRVLLSDSSLWKAARANSHKLFMNTLLMDPFGKKSFAIHFTKNYKQIQKDFIEDDHDHSVSATSLSVQVYTVPTVARMLMLEHDALRLILRAFIDELRSDVPGVLDFKKRYVPIRKLMYMLTDLRYLLLHTPTEWSESLRGKFDSFLEDFFGLLKMMQGMDMTTRKTGRHAEMEADWETPFNLQLRLMPILGAVRDWCCSDVRVFTSSVRKAIEALKETVKRQTVEISLKKNEVCGRQVKLIEFDVTTGPVSIHLPISRFLGGLVLACAKFNLSFSDLFGFEKEGDKMKLLLMEFPLRTLVMVAQVHAGMWRRNGYCVMNQVYHYQNVNCRSEMYDKDVIVMQAAASFLEGDYFVTAVLHRYGLLDWIRADFNENKYDQDTLNHKMSIAEEFLSLLIAIVGERYVPGVGEVTSEEVLRREILHRLFIRPQAHSELLKALPCADLDANDKSNVDQVISSVAVYKSPGVTGRGLYKLKPELHQDYNPFFYHYTRIDQSKAEEQRNRRSKKESTSEVHPVPVPPQFCAPFTRAILVLDCKPTVALLSTLLARAARGQSKAVSDLMVQQVLHLICLALHEQKRQRTACTVPTFNFVKTASMATDTSPSLLNTLQGLQCKQELAEHLPLVEWILKAFREEQQAREATGGDARDGLATQPGISSLQDEKERKARLARERREKIMAQMSEAQKAFIKENAELLAAVSTGSDSVSDDVVPDVTQREANDEPVVLGERRQRKELKSMPYITEPCILCQEPQEVNMEGRAIVIAAYVQRSTVLSKARGKMFDSGDELDPLYPPGDLFWGVHVSSCGHAMHSDCWQGFYDSVLAKERRAMRLRQVPSVDVSRREFLCPLCGCLANTVLPILPALSPREGHSAPAVTVPGFLSGMQDAVTRNLHVLANENEDNMKQPEPPRDAASPEGVQPTQPPRLKFSSSLKEMLKIFSQSAFTVGLGVQPNESDKRACVLAWNTCSYTIQSTENAHRAGDKGLFAGLSSSRQSLCIGAATRVAALQTAVCDANFIRTHCLRMLAVLTPHSVQGVSGPSLLELNVFGLMVQLRLSLPGLLDALREDRAVHTAVRSLGQLGPDSSLDEAVFRVAFLARLIQVLLTAPPDLQSSDLQGEEAMEQDGKRDEECVSLASLWGRVRHWAGMQSCVSHESPWQLHVHVKKLLLPFLRSSALFFHFLTEIAGPTALKGDVCTGGDEEYGVLCRYLGLPDSVLQLVQWNQDSHDISSPVVSQTVRRWCGHEQVRRILAAAGVEPLGYSIEPNFLLNLPHDYSELINRASLFTCPNSDGNDSRAPVLCLVCGEMLCSQSYCCQITLAGDKVGACAAHAQKCGAGVGVFVRVRECQVLLMANKNRGCFYPPPYLDNYGETDQGLRRGNPLYLCPDRYRKLQMLWLTHCVAEEVAHCLESNRNLLSIDWTNL